MCLLGPQGPQFECPRCGKRHGLQTMVKLAYPAFDEHCNECCKDHNSQTSIKQSIHNNNVFWRGEFRQDIWPKAQIMHHLRLVYEYVLDDIHGVWFEMSKEFDEESTQETHEQCCLDNQSMLPKDRGRIYI